MRSVASDSPGTVGPPSTLRPICQSVSGADLDTGVAEPIEYVRDITEILGVVANGHEWSIAAGHNNVAGAGRTVHLSDADRLTCPQLLGLVRELNAATMRQLALHLLRPRTLQRS